MKKIDGPCDSSVTASFCTRCGTCTCPKPAFERPVASCSLTFSDSTHLDNVPLYVSPDVPDGQILVTGTNKVARALVGHDDFVKAKSGEDLQVHKIDLEELTVENCPLHGTKSDHGLNVDELFYEGQNFLEFVRELRDA